MRVSLALFALAVPVVAACSSSSNDKPACAIAGTYTMTTVPETQSEGCKDLPPDDGTPVTVTITALSDGSFGLQFSGLTGGCVGTTTDTCKLQTKCDIEIRDTPDGGAPTQVNATLQDAWTFNASGFSGLNSGSIPPLSSLPKGCNTTTNATGTRR